MQAFIFWRTTGEYKGDWCAGPIPHFFLKDLMELFKSRTRRNLVEKCCLMGSDLPRATCPCVVRCSAPWAQRTSRMHPGTLASQLSDLE